ncbi:hypothetical protein FS749_016551 [Ceratobasidium sp. UAMH 11750]|nr:hypothetical protein FS749_016551 [Ceratobasidium sp. UAMH 11750]
MYEWRAVRGSAEDEEKEVPSEGDGTAVSVRSCAEPELLLFPLLAVGVGSLLRCRLEVKPFPPTLIALSGIEAIPPSGATSPRTPFLRLRLLRLPSPARYA